MVDALPDQPTHLVLTDSYPLVARQDASTQTEIATANHGIQSTEPLRSAIILDLSETPIEIFYSDCDESEEDEGTQNFSNRQAFSDTFPPIEYYHLQDVVASCIKFYAESKGFDVVISDRCYWKKSEYDAIIKTLDDITVENKLHIFVDEDIVKRYVHEKRVKYYIGMKNYKTLTTHLIPFYDFSMEKFVERYGDLFTSTTNETSSQSSTETSNQSSTETLSQSSSEDEILRPSKYNSSDDYPLVSKPKNESTSVEWSSSESFDLTKLEK